LNRAEQLVAQEAVVKNRILAWTFLGAALLSAGAVCGDAAEVVEIRLRGRYFMEPATVHIMVAVEPDADNRTLRIEADGDTMFRASDLMLSGANEKRIHAVEFKNLPAGTYVLRAQVLSSQRVRGMAEQPLVVSGSGQR
jgi:hypothetical protein